MKKGKVIRIRIESLVGGTNFDIYYHCKCGLKSDCLEAARIFIDGNKEDEKQLKERFEDVKEEFSCNKESKTHKFTVGIVDVEYNINII